MIEINNLSLELRGKPLLQNLEFTLTTGEVACLVGPNGAGKSTLLKVLSGDYANYQGQVTFDGQELKLWSNDELARCRGVLPQQSLLSFPYKVREVVALGRTPHHTGRKVDEEIIHQALASTDVSHLQERIYLELSGGEKQRVQLARVLAQIWPSRAYAQTHSLLLLDEPVAALDLAHQQMVLEQARDMAKANVAVLVVLHDLNLAARYADRILVLQEGQLRHQGKPEEIVTAAMVQQVFDVAVTVSEHPHLGHPIIHLS